MRAADFFDLPESLARFAPYFSAEVAPWAWLPQIKTALAGIKGNTAERDLPPGIDVQGEVWLDPTVRLPAYATLIGPAYISANTEIRPGAFVRGNVIVGAGAVLGNACEFKNCLLLDGVQVPHFNYVGDSVLGNKAHLGAGVILSNLRLDQQAVIVQALTGPIETGLRKFGAVLGDGAEVGCNAVLNPGSVLGKRALVMPTVAFSGWLGAAQIVRARTSLVTFPRRD